MLIYVQKRTSLNATQVPKASFTFSFYPLASGNAEGTFLRLPYTSGFPGESCAPPPPMKLEHSKRSGRCCACNSQAAQLLSEGRQQLAGTRLSSSCGPEGGEGGVGGRGTAHCVPILQSFSGMHGVISGLRSQPASPHSHDL